MTSIKKWLLAIRPKTLAISVAPVLVGSSLAWTENGQLNWLVALTALTAAILIQIGTNLHNDAADFERGTDTEARIGPARATAQGWFTASQVKQAAYIAFGLAFIIGIFLAWIGGWPIIIIGLLSLTAGYSYTGGIKPIAYSASGEFFVFLFFGLVAVMGTYYIQTLSLSLNAFYLASATGLWASAVLLVNNYRDLKTDQQANKLTLTHYLGRSLSKNLYLILMLTPYLFIFLTENLSMGKWLALLTLPLSLRLVYRFYTESPGPIFNIILAQTAQSQLLFSGLLSLGLLL